uniref:Peptidase_S9 domain-containing protein n=1 Tax=Panagrellus redivivus TaxID=6233 RepID=A0A7E4VYV0_PANRE
MSTVSEIVDHRMKNPEAGKSKVDALQLMINAIESDKVVEASKISKINAEFVSENVQNAKFSKNKVTKKKIVAQMTLFLLAGYETTATTLQFALYCLTHYPEIQEKARAEVETVIGDKETLDFDDISRLVYVKQVIYETLRMFAPAPRVTRTSTRHIRINDIDFEPGVAFSAQVWYVHYDENNYPEPEKFDPERFLPEVKAERDPGAFLAFGGGPRTCIGMRFAEFEMLMTLAHLLRRFRSSEIGATPMSRGSKERKESSKERKTSRSKSKELKEKNSNERANDSRLASTQEETIEAANNETPPSIVPQITQTSVTIQSSDATQQSSVQLESPIVNTPIPLTGQDATQKSESLESCTTSSYPEVLPQSPTPNAPPPPPPEQRRRILPRANPFSGGGEQRQHRRGCFERNRKTLRRHAGPVIPKYRHKDFLKAVDAHRDTRNVIDCVCEPERFPVIRSCKFYIQQAFRQCSSCFYTICCPPCPKQCLAKIAFWPPNRGYFFVHYNKRLPWSQALVQKHKIAKGNRRITIEENYSIGLEHNCCDRIDGLSVFVIENAFHQFIAGFVARPRRGLKSNIWIIYSHPNGSDLSDLMTLMPSPVQVSDFLNCNVVAYDYPGYGLSSGKPFEDGFYATIDAVIAYVHTDLKVPMDHIVLWGYSIGTVCSVHAAMTHDVAGVVLFAPVASIVRTMKANTCFDNRSRRIHTRTGRFDSFATIDMITRVKVPILIAHGELDTLIPITHGQALVERARKTNPAVYSLWVPYVGHNNIPNSSDLWRRVKHFIDTEIRNAAQLHVEEPMSIRREKRRRRKTKRSRDTRRRRTSEQHSNAPKSPKAKPKTIKTADASPAAASPSSPARTVVPATSPTPSSIATTQKGAVSSK